MQGRTVWLASYPKSGNTWVRAIVTALGEHPHLFGVDHLISGAQPFQVGMALGAFGADPRWMSDEELDEARAALAVRIGGAADGPPVLRKTHERYRRGTPGREPIPLAATRAAILVVRDPRDVAASYAAFFDIGIDEAISAMAREGGDVSANAFRAQTPQPWGTWSSHAESWLDPDVPFPVHLVRYEDLIADATSTLMPVLRAIGLTCTHEHLAAAVERTQFEKLQESETERGFRETSPRTRRFFRTGRAGGWHAELNAAQADAIVADHGEVMARLGYGAATGARADRTDPLTLPPILGITVSEGTVPTDLPGAQRPGPWLQVTPRAALLRFPAGAGLLVEDGITATLDRGSRPRDEVAWMVQGWAVTLAMLQRGMLSLHASTVDVGGRVFAVAGARGAGKSTTAMGLRGRGHALLCDDVTLVEFRGDGAWTTPYWRNVHLLEDSADALGVDFASLPALGPRRMKSAFRAEAPADEPRRINGIIVLALSDSAVEVTVARLAGTARMSALLDHTSRDGIAPLVLGQERYFAEVAHLADLVPITVVTRPRDDWTLDAVLDAIEAATSE